MKSLKKNNLNMIIFTLVLSLGCLTIAYAVLSTTLNISFGNVTQNAITWDVGFEGTTVEGVSGGTSDTGRSCGLASLTSNTVTLASTSLSKPGDKCTYPLKIKNNGGIVAELAAITPRSPTDISCTATGPSMVCGNITYKLANDSEGTTSLSLNTTLGIEEEKIAYLVVSYTGNTLNSTSVTQANGGFTITYNQK